MTDELEQIKGKEKFSLSGSSVDKVVLAIVVVVVTFGRIVVVTGETVEGGTVVLGGSGSKEATTRVSTTCVTSGCVKL